jgi:hypothetical protein
VLNRNAERQDYAVSGCFDVHLIADMIYSKTPGWRQVAISSARHHCGRAIAYAEAVDSMDRAVAFKEEFRLVHGNTPFFQ